MNKRIKKEKRNSVKKWAVKEGLFFFDKKGFVFNPSIYTLPAGTKVLLSNNFEDWIEMGIGDKTEFNFYKSKKICSYINKR